MGLPKKRNMIILPDMCKGSLHTGLIEKRDIISLFVSEFLYEQGVIKPECPGWCEFAPCITHDIRVKLSYFIKCHPKFIV